MMLTHTEYIQPQLIRQLNFLHKMVKPLRRTYFFSAARISCGFCKRIDANFHTVMRMIVKFMSAKFGNNMTTLNGDNE